MTLKGQGNVIEGSSKQTNQQKFKTKDQRSNEINVFPGQKWKMFPPSLPSFLLLFLSLSLYFINRSWAPSGSRLCLNLGTTAESPPSRKVPSNGREERSTKAPTRGDGPGGGQWAPQEGDPAQSESSFSRRALLSQLSKYRCRWYLITLNIWSGLSSSTHAPGDFWSPWPVFYKSPVRSL